MQQLLQFSAIKKKLNPEMRERNQNVGFPRTMAVTPMHSYHITYHIHTSVHGSDRVCIDIPQLAFCPSTVVVERTWHFAAMVTCRNAWQQRCNNVVSLLATCRGSTSEGPINERISRVGNAFTLQ